MLGKINGGWSLEVGRKDLEKWAFLSVIRVRNGESSDDDRLPAIFPDFLGKSWATHVSPKWPHFR